MEDSLEQAVEIALQNNGDGALRQQATDFCQQVKTSNEGWQVCLSLFQQLGKRSDNSRFFALQVLEDVLRNRIPDFGESVVEVMRRALMGWLVQALRQDAATFDQPFLRNKLAEVISLIFVHLYTTAWRSFFDDFYVLMFGTTDLRASDASNPRAVDFFFRVLIAVESEIADVLIVRSAEEAKRSSLIKDEIRARDMAKLPEVWFTLFARYQDSQKGIVAQGLKVVAAWASWMDISLIVNEPFMAFLFNLLRDPELKNASCEALIGIVSKKMSVTDKVQLVSLLNLPALMSALDKDIEDDPDFAENVAKLTDVQVVALAQASLSGELQGEALTRVTGMLINLVPNVLRFLANEYDDTSSAVFHSVNDVITVVRKFDSADATRRRILSQLLQAIILKMKYDETSDWGPDADAVEDAEFQELRGKLKNYQDMILQADQELYLAAVVELVSTTFAKGTQQDWRDVELALYELYIYGEAIKGFPRDSELKERAVAAQNRMLDELFLHDISRFPHASVQDHFFEILNRYHPFFAVRPAALLKAIEAFIDVRGLHNPVTSVQYRAWYLFSKFVRQLRTQLSNVAGDVLNAVEDLLIIKVDTADEMGESDEDSDSVYASSAGKTDPFDHKLNLYEAIGTFLSAPSVPVEEQIRLGMRALQPLFANIESVVSGVKRDRPNMIFLQRNISAIGCFAQGFPLTSKSTAANGTDLQAWSQIFDRAASYIMVAFNAQVDQAVIREAARFAFARLINVADEARILPQMPPLVSGIIKHSTISQLTDFLPFYGQLIFKLKAPMKPLVDETLSPLLQRVFALLSTEVQGTDDALALSELRKAYLQLMFQLFNNRIDDVFFSPRNQPTFEPYLASVVHCLRMDDPDAQMQKHAFALVREMTKTWCTWIDVARKAKANPPPATQRAGSGSTNNAGATGKSSGATSGGKNAGNGTGGAGDMSHNRPLRGFDDYACGTVLPICFEVPIAPGFSMRDAGKVQVVAEIATVVRQVWLMRGPDPIDGCLASAGVPADQRRQFTEALDQTDSRGFKNAFRDFVIACKGA